MPRVAICALAAALTLIASAPAQAGDPLLSGYSGPGGGDQAVLGSSTLPAGSSGSSTKGSLKASGTNGSAPAPASTTATAPPSTSSQPSAGAPSSTSTGKAPTSKSGSKRKSRTPSPSSAAKPATTSDPGTQAVPVATVRYPSTAQAAGALPISSGGLLAVLAAVAVLIAMAVATSRLSAARPERG